MLYDRPVQTILNVFPKTKFTYRKLVHNHTTELFWFSQTVGQNRGIEEVVLAIADLPEHNFKLNLLGELTANDHEYFCRFFKKNNINKKLVMFHQTIADSEIIDFASKYDIGLATETGSPFNRDICLTNKIFTYNQAGLAILATDTTAQKDLLSRYPNMGLIYKRNDLEDLKRKLLCYRNANILENTKNQSYNYGQNMLNWETESQKFLAIIKKNLSN